MSKDLNLCQFIGRVGKDIEMRQTNNGAACANLSIAVNDSYKDKKTGDKVETTEWVRVSAFGKLAEIMAQYLAKGSQVYISGKLQTRKWQDQSGADRYTTEIVANEMQMLGGKASAQAAKPVTQPEAANGANDFDDDLPF